MKVYIDEKYHHAADPSIRPHKQKNSGENQLNVEFSTAPTTDQTPPPPVVINTASQMSTPKTAIRNTNKPTAVRRQSFGGSGIINTVKSGANSRSSTLTRVNANTDENYGKDIKNIPKATWKLLTNKIYIVTCLVS